MKTLRYVLVAAAMTDGDRVVRSNIFSERLSFDIVAMEEAFFSGVKRLFYSFHNGRIMGFRRPPENRINQQSDRAMAMLGLS